MTVGSKVKQTLADLQGIEGTLMIYSMQSRNVEERKAFEEAVKDAHKVVNDIEMRMKTLEYQEPQYKGF